MMATGNARGGTPIANEISEAPAGFLVGTGEGAQVLLGGLARKCTVGRSSTPDQRRRALNLFAVRRADIESFARELEARGRARATVTRRLCTIAGFYKYAVEEELLEHSPAAHVRRPRSTTSPTLSRWTATSSMRCWWPPGSARRPSTR